MKKNFVVMALLLFVSFQSCSQDSAPGPKESSPIKYLALGDSYTIGQSVPENERWPVQLAAELKSNGYEVSYSDIIARTGWTTTNLLDAIEQAEDKEYNLVSLLIGVNNQYQGKPFELFVEELDILIETAIEKAGSSDRVFLVSIPDYGVTPFGSSNQETIAREIDQYNDQVRKRANELSLPYIDVTTISREMGDQEGALASDQLHPSGEQYKRWKDAILPTVLMLLEK